MKHSRLLDSSSVEFYNLYLVNNFIPTPEMTSVMCITSSISQTSDNSSRNLINFRKKSCIFKWNEKPREQWMQNKNMISKKSEMKRTSYSAKTNFYFGMKVFPPGSVIAQS